MSDIMEDLQDEKTSQRLNVIRALVVLGVVVVAVLALLPNIRETVDEFVPVETLEVECIIGSEKSGFLSNEEVQRILAEDYRLSVSFRRMGSIEQVQIEPVGVDCLWPSNTSALEIFLENDQDIAGNIEDEIIFNSPIVLYSWQPVVDALLAEGLFVQQPEGHLTANAFEIVNLLTAETRPSWGELGMDALFGSFNVITTDPTRSNSGNMFYALMANILNDGNAATAQTIDQSLPTIRQYFDRQGRMEESSGFLFEQFTRLGMGANPIIANYESLLIEFSIENQENIDEIMQQIRIIYLMPTVWSSHPLIALNDRGSQLLEALRDERLQRIAWEQHGFRSGLAGVENDPDVFNISGITEDVTSVLPLPRSNAILKMLEFLEDS